MNKTVLITGASGKLGRQLIKVYKNYNYNIITHCHGKSGDLTCEESVKNFASNIPKIDILICVVGKKIEADPLGDLDEFIQMFNINLISTFLCCKYISPKINDNGQIITIGSVDGMFGQSSGAMYGSIKSALHFYTRALSKKLSNLKVNCVAPGTFYNEICIEKIAQTIFQISQTNYLNGQIIRVDDGHHTFPC